MVHGGVAALVKSMVINEVVDHSVVVMAPYCYNSLQMAFKSCYTLDELL